MTDPINSIMQFYQETSPDYGHVTRARTFLKFFGMWRWRTRRKAAEIGNIADIAGMWTRRDEVAVEEEEKNNTSLSQSMKQNNQHRKYQGELETP